MKAPLHPHFPEFEYTNWRRFYLQESQVLEHLGCHFVENALPKLQGIMLKLFYAFEIQNK